MGFLQRNAWVIAMRAYLVGEIEASAVFLRAKRREIRSVATFVQHVAGISNKTAGKPRFFAI